jgi:hypothetical protein
LDRKYEKVLSEFLERDGKITLKCVSRRHFEERKWVKLA